MNHQDVLDDIRLQRGGLVEIYVLGTSHSEWRRMISEFVDAGYVTHFTEGGKAVDVYFDTRFFDTADDLTHSISLDMDGQLWTSTFLSEEAIDLQGDPTDIETLDDLQKVIALMNKLHRITGKRVIFVPETLDLTRVSPWISVG